MEDRLKTWIKNPNFPEVLQVALQSFISGNMLLTNVGIDVTPEVLSIFERIKELLNEAAYEQMDVLELLKRAQKLGDDTIGKKKEDNTEVRRKIQDSSKRDFE